MFLDMIGLGDLGFYEFDQIMYFLIIDKDGNVVFNIYMINLDYGLGLVVEGMGVLMNNEMDDFLVKFGVFNVFGLIGGEVNVVVVGKWLLFLMMLMLVLKDGKVWLVMGLFGGVWIIIMVLQVVMNMIDYGMNVVEVLIVLCIYYQWLFDELCIEEGISVDILWLLVVKGYVICEQFMMGLI